MTNNSNKFDFCLIIPTLHEEKNISRLKLALDLNLKKHKYFICFVDDSANNLTKNEIISTFEKGNTEILYCGQNDICSAVKYCMEWCSRNINSNYFIEMDADLSHNPKEIPVMLDLLKDYDLIIGSRYCDGISVVRWPLRRLVLSYGANLYSRVITGMSIKDATGGFKVWKKEVLESIGLKKIRSNGYSFQIEMNFRTWRKGFNIIEHPIIFIDRTIGESKMSKSIMYEAVFVVWRLRIWKLFGWNK